MKYFPASNYKNLIDFKVKEFSDNVSTQFFDKSD